MMRAGTGMARLMALPPCIAPAEAVVTGRALDVRIGRRVRGDTLRDPWGMGGCFFSSRPFLSGAGAGLFMTAGAVQRLSGSPFSPWLGPLPAWRLTGGCDCIARAARISPSLAGKACVGALWLRSGRRKRAAMTGRVVARPMRPTAAASLAMAPAACPLRPGRRTTGADRLPARAA
ncbi:hypothetical protein LV564_06570 [Komagataeibacter nataicola]|nr:hypothetical protein [Komagataeibacter nataicola]WEQ56733.1 hypothetical protein LV564_06570 [Komagataeibacter nataicola]